MKFVLSNFLSSEDLSISYEGWDVQLTFDTLINAFRFKAKPIGGAKVKNAYDAKLAEFRKNVCHLFNFHQKFMNFFLVKDLTNRLLLLLFVSFWEHTLGGCDTWKMDDLFQRPLAPISIIPKFSKKKFGESWNPTAFIKKKAPRTFRVNQIRQFTFISGDRFFFVKFHPFFGKLFFWIDAKIVHIYKIDDFTWIEKDV